ncbi:cyclic nucleotide-binding domain-containing protein [Leptospira levettii]|uniref:cyclic nucleotide-binding domain-containing protein n=1 Tax=Leptospira levettii TaxID=2023178 RepID=UPI001083A389|nr:cyclic nucleotide-binding domain-containing protein [Leptospira levettii]TGL14187.1 cyclic nucleotide-binding domain-containing protein [Leptospira levettii]
MMFLDILPKDSLLIKSYHSGEFVYQKGESSSEGICFVLNGKVETDHIDQENHIVKLVINQFKFFGLSAFVSNIRMDTVKAMEDGTKVLFISESDFSFCMNADSQFIIRAIQYMMNYIQTINIDTNHDLMRSYKLNTILDQVDQNRLAKMKEQNLRIHSQIYHSRFRLVNPGQFVYSEENLVDSDLYLILEGEVVHYVNDPKDPKKEIPILRLEPGYIFGFIKKDANKGHVLNVRAGSNGALTIHLDSDLLRQVAKNDEMVAYSIFQTLCLLMAMIENLCI